MAGRILFVGDVHLGRRPSSLPDDLAGFGVDADELTPRAAWRAAVEFGLRERVDALVFAGDVVESDNARYEALGPLAEGVRRLAEAGVDVLGVSGNHDVEALPRLAREIAGFRLIGAGGRWERVTLERNGRAWVHLDGWSFAESHPARSPFRDGAVAPPPQDGAPCLGLLHADLDSPGSRYLPVRRSELQSTFHDAWLLGHVHKPDDLTGRRPIGYLGSLVGLDPTETGWRGPWLARIGGPGRVELERVGLGSLRWEACRLEAASLAADAGLFGALNATIARLHAGLEEAGGEPPRAVGLRATVVGKTPRHAELRAELASGAATDLRRACGETLWFLESVVDRSLPAIDLTALAREDHPAGLLARHLLALERGGDEALELVRAARPRLRSAAEAAAFAALAEPAELGDEAIRERLIEAGSSALEALLAQRPSGERAAR